MGNAHLSVSGPYVVANAHIDTFAVYTNNIPSGAFRGFGSPQALLAAEGQMNRLAAALDMDPLEIRLKNSIREGSIGTFGSAFVPGVSMPEVFEACGRESYWGNAGNGWKLEPAPQPVDPSKRRGRGMAGGFKNVGFSFGFPENCWAGIELQGAAEIERVILYHAGADVGQGAHTALSQMAAEAVGVDFEQVTAGRFKRTLTLFGKNTEAGREKLREEIEDVHDLFKTQIATHRPQLDVEQVATGEYWYGTRALELGLIDEIRTSDDFLAEAVAEADLYKVSYKRRLPLPERILAGAESLLRR
jgi:hypothetical protein